MAYPGWDVFPGWSLYPGAHEDTAVRGTVALPAETLEQLLAGPRRVIATVTVSKDGRTVELPVTSGSVSESWDSTPRSTASLTVAVVPEWVPDGPGHLLDPRAQARIRITFAISGPRTRPTPFTYGVYVITQASVGGDGIGLTLADLSHVVRGRLMTGPMVVHPGLDPLEQAGRLLARRCPWVRVSGPSGLAPTAEWLSGEAGADPWVAAQAVAKAAGAALFFDHEGGLQMQRITDPLVAPVAATWETGPDSVLADVGRDLDGTEMPQAVIVKWSRGVEVVPADPDGDGQLVVWEGDPETVADAVAARAAGEADLALRRGAVESVTVKAWPRYGLHVGDVVRVLDPATHTSTTARVTKLNVPLDGGPMDVALADRRVA